jgi:hypothetical protein
MLGRFLTTTYYLYAKRYATALASRRPLGLPTTYEPITLIVLS